MLNYKEIFNYVEFFSEIWNFDDTFDEYADYAYCLQTLKTLCQITLISRLKWLKLKL